MNKFYLKLGAGIFSVLLLLAGVLFFLQNQEREVTSEEFLMDTLVSISTYGTDTDFLQRATEKAFKEIRGIADLTDRFPSPGTTAYERSDVVKINESAGIGPVTVDEDVFKMLQLAQDYNQFTEGEFDVTIGPLMDLWGFGRETQKVPTVVELQKTLALVDSSKLILNEEMLTAFLSQKEMNLDLGAVAKGYAVEKAAQVLREEGVEKALINAGGNIRVIGEKDKHTAWKIGIQDPRDSSGLMGILSLNNEAAVTSGDYNRLVEIEGKSYHHLLSAQTGYPAINNMSVTVVCPDAGQADLLSTSLFLLEPQQALEAVSRINNVEVVIITTAKEIICSPGLRDKFEYRSGEGYSYDQN
jgi:thiamine biosynthesis lipoprotein